MTVTDHSRHLANRVAILVLFVVIAAVNRPGSRRI